LKGEERWNIDDSQDPPEVKRKRKLKTENHRLGREMKSARVQDGCDKGGGGGGGMGAESQTAGAFRFFWNHTRFLTPPDWRIC
jgi:hypothetical protein